MADKLKKSGKSQQKTRSMTAWAAIPEPSTELLCTRIGTGKRHKRKVRNK
jgi:hypothetical protein